MKNIFKVKEEEYIEYIRKIAKRTKSKKVLILIGNFFAALFWIVINYFFFVIPIRNHTVDEFPLFSTMLAFTITLLTALGILFLILVKSYRLFKPKLSDRLLIQYYDKLNSE